MYRVICTACSTSSNLQRVQVSQGNRALSHLYTRNFHIYDSTKTPPHSRTLRIHAGGPQVKGMALQRANVHGWLLSQGLCILYCKDTVQSVMFCCRLRLHRTTNSVINCIFHEIISYSCLVYLKIFSCTTLKFCGRVSFVAYERPLTAIKNDYEIVD